LISLPNNECVFENLPDFICVNNFKALVFLLTLENEARSGAEIICPSFNLRKA
jgi:hypothetical protein